MPPRQTQPVHKHHGLYDTGNKQYRNILTIQYFLLSYKQALQKGFNMKFKVPYSIRKSLIKILPFVATAIMAISCHKTKYDAVIEWDWDIDGAWAPPKEMVKTEADKREVENVIIKLTYANCSGVSPKSFHRARDTLQTRINIAPAKIR